MLLRGVLVIGGAGAVAQFAVCGVLERSQRVAGGGIIRLLRCRFNSRVTLLMMFMEQSVVLNLLRF
jgi:hypothetical protein